DFTAELEQAIKRASHIVVCVTPDVERPDSFVRREIFYAYIQEKPIIPLLFTDKKALPLSIAPLTWIDFRQARSNAVAQLLERLKVPFSVANLPESFDDPFRKYLNDFYEQIVEYLDATVFTMISLRTKTKQDAVAIDIPGLRQSIFGHELV